MFVSASIKGISSFAAETSGPSARDRLLQSGVVPFDPGIEVVDDALGVTVLPWLSRLNRLIRGNGTKKTTRIAAATSTTPIRV